MWRNFGIVVALWVFFLVLLMFSIERLPAAGSNKSVLLYKPGGGGKFIRAAAKNGNEPRDEEEGGGEGQAVEKPRGEKSGNDNKEKRSDKEKDESTQDKVVGMDT